MEDEEGCVQQVLGWDEFGIGGAMGILNWLRSADERFVDRAKDAAGGYAQRASDARDAQLAQITEGLISGQVKAEDLAPELLYHLRQEAMKRKAPAEVADARGRLGVQLGLPADGTQASRDQLVQQLIASGIAGEGTSPMPVDERIVNGIAQLQAASNPTIGRRTYGALEGINSQIASNKFARGGAYAGAAAGGALGAVGLTEAGMGLLELAGIIESEDQADQAEAQRRAQG
jgi:hypothetical protein